MPNYRRNRIPGGTYFFTVNVLDRRSDTLVAHVDALRDAVGRVRTKHPFHIDAWVVLPDHMHAVWTLPPGDGDYSSRWREIKKAFVKALPHTEFVDRGRILRRERGVWQRRFWEHTIRDERDYANHVDYVHVNPVKHGHVRAVRDWPFSSFHRLVARGVYPPDWAGDDVGDCAGGERRE